MNNKGEHIFKVDIGGTNIKLAIFEFASQIWYLNRIFTSKPNSLFIIILSLYISLGNNGSQNI